jgi:hypothetical protein
VALMRGPLMLVAVDAQSGQARVGADFTHNLKAATHQPQTFTLAEGPETLRFAPFYAVGSDSYTTYLQSA